ncbi:MAG: GGDEF domain-containing protein [Aeromonadaceae bacterium]
MLQWINRRLGRQLLLSLLVLALLLTLLISAGQLAYFYHRAQAQAEQEIDRLVQGNLQSLSSGLWELDFPRVKGVLGDILLHPLVSNVVLVAQDGIHMEHGLSHDGDLSKTYPIYWQGSVVGQLTIHLALSRLYAPLWQDIRLQLLLNLLCLLLVFGALFGLVQYWIARPVKDLLTLTQGLDLASLDKRPLPRTVLRSRNELYHLGQAWLAMRQRLRSGLAQRLRAERQLNRQQNELENQIAERTLRLAWHSAMDELIAELSMLFLTATVECTEPILGKALKKMANFISLSHFQVVESHGQYFCYRQGDNPERIARVLATESTTGRWLRQRLLQPRPFYIADEHHPHSGTQWCQVLRCLGWRSLVILPLLDGTLGKERAFGALLLGWRDTPCHYPDELRVGLERIANLISLLLIRERQQLRMEQMQSDLRYANARLRELADRDPLTGLHNRRPFDERVELALLQEQPFALLMLDIDFFKRYNDRYGHLEGDRALILVAESLKSALQEGELVSRFGGEEFSMLLRESDEAHLRQRIEALLSRVAQLHILHEDAPLGWLSVSIGGVQWSGEAGLSCTQLLRRADEALYLAKHNGRCCGFLGNLQILPQGGAITLGEHGSGKKTGRAL